MLEDKPLKEITVNFNTDHIKVTNDDGSDVFKSISDSIKGTNPIEVEVTKPVGRPTDYSQELSDKICALIAEGLSVRTICLQDDMPSMQTFFTWLRVHKEFLEQYERAKEQSAYVDEEKLEETGDKAIEMSQIVDPKASNAVVSAYKLKADNLKWFMSKKKPKKYGDKLDVMSDGKAIQGNTIIFKDFKGDTEQ